MKQHIYLIENLDCANCAAKIESKINALPEVQEATIAFATKQLHLTAEDPDALIPELIRIARTVEREVTIRSRDDHHVHEHHHGCDCGHHHECNCGHHKHDHECGCDHQEHECDCGHHHDHDHHSDEDTEKREILLGAVLFTLGLVLNLLKFPLLSLGVFYGAYLILGHRILVNAWKGLRQGHMLDENFLMSLASLGAIVIGEAAEAVGVMLFYRVGEYFEHRAVERSRSQIMEAIDLRPEVVHLADGSTIPAENAHPGDILILRPGDRIPLDGIVLSGTSRIDTAPITGEPVPVSVEPGNKLISGCVNTTGQLTMKVEKTLGESMVTRILNSVENAAASKPKIDRFITRFARIYTPIVVGLATAVAIIPSLVTGNWDYWVYTALSFLVMSCPCALVLSVPLAFFSGIGAASRRGILFKGGASMEALGAVKAVAMDKTGTLTKGEFKVRQIAGGLDILRLCASCEQRSTHPIAQSIVSAAQERDMELFEPDSLEEIPGRGIRATADGNTILCGNERLMWENGIQFGTLEDAPGTRVLVAVQGRFVGYLVISDILKESASAAVSALKSLGCTTAMLTGDNEDTAHQIAHETGIHEVHAKLLPEDKLTCLRQLRQRHGSVMYVGDGINDAPVLAGADVGAAMGSGADAAIEAADVVFMTSDPEAIPASLTLARATARIALQNVIFALAIKFGVMLLGLAGHASMWMAVFADSGVAMLCVLNSIRILYKKN